MAFFVKPPNLELIIAELISILAAIAVKIGFDTRLRSHVVAQKRDITAPH
ncbi:MAG: hypothetical protein P8M80_07310 [Pirellulaceae bacterium]|nr:hypothetical protein [Pirellulaceae bacterium]